MAERGADAGVVYLDCPVCGHKVLEPFVRGSLQFHTHFRRGGGNAQRCRFIVDVAPSGDDHRFHVLQRGERAEDVLPELAASPERIRRLLSLAHLAVLSHLPTEGSLPCSTG